MAIHARLSTRPPEPCHHVADFDLVTVDGRLIVVASPDRDRLACTWDPAAERWTMYELDVPDEDFPHTELTAFGAAIVDGRIVVGGGGEHQGFAMWDLESGAVRLSAEEGSPTSVVRAELGVRSTLVVGFANSWGVELWDPTVTDEVGDGEQVNELECRSTTGSAAAAGTVAGRPVVVSVGRDGNVLAWDVAAEQPLVEFAELADAPTDFALVSVDGRDRVVAAGGRSLVLGDPESGEWGEPVAVPGGEISCLAAGVFGGRPVAVTGAVDGAVWAWDLLERQQLGELVGFGSEMFGVRVAEVDGQPVAIGCAHNDAMRLWELPL